MFFFRLIEKSFAIVLDKLFWSRLLFSCAFFIGVGYLSLHAFANPSGGQIVSGDIQITQPSSTQMTINQSTEKGIINWQAFDIASDEHTHFNQPSAAAITLNRVIGGGGASSIMGRLSATGQIMLINPAGVLFGPSARVDVSGLVATTANISNTDFLNDRFRFTQSFPTYGQIINQGQITIRGGGLAALVAPHVSNQGVIVAELGRVVLASGSEYTLDLYGDGLIEFSVGASQVSGNVSNSGMIQANGGTVLMTTQAVAATLDNVINMDGIIEANTVVSKKGEIILLAHGNGGQVKVSGELSVKGRQLGEDAGRIQISAEKVIIESSATFDAAAYHHGGTIYIGGDELRSDALLTADYVTIEHGVEMFINSLHDGNAGTVISWANEQLDFGANIVARGGPAGGDGGFVETSSAVVNIDDPVVDLYAPLGNAGTWLFDPVNQIINPPLANTIVNTLTLGGNFILSTNLPGGNPGNITVNSPIVVLGGPGTGTLTLEFNNQLNVNQPITGNFDMQIITVPGNNNVFNFFNVIAPNSLQIDGGDGNDTFVFGDGIQIAGNIDGGVGFDTFDFSANTTGITATLTNNHSGTITNVSGNFINMESFIGSAAANNDTLVGPNDPNVWNISGDGATVVIDVDGFQANNNVEFLTGGTDTDTLVVEYSNYMPQTWVINGTNQGTVQGTGQVLRTFSGMENLTGASTLLPSGFFQEATLDTFTMNDGAQITGTLSDSNIDVTFNYLVPLTVSIQPGGSVTHGGGTVIGVTNFLHKVAVTGGPGMDTLIGPGSNGCPGGSVYAGCAWNIGNDSGGITTTSGAAPIAYSATFNSFENINANGYNNAIRMLPGSTLSGSLTGGSLEYTSYGAPVTVNLETGAAPGIAGGVSNLFYVTGSGLAGDILIGKNGSQFWSLRGNQTTWVGFPLMNYATNATIGSGVGIGNFEAIVGGTGDDTFTNIFNTLSVTIDGGLGNNTFINNHATDTTWTISGNDSGSIPILSFSNIQNLTGGSGDDLFSIQDTFNISGNIDGGAHTVGDTLDYSAYTTPISIDMNNVSNVENLIASGQPNDSLTGSNSGNIWVMTGAGAGTINGVNFSGVENLVGGTGSDSFQVSSAAFIGSIVGGAGSDTLIGQNVATAWSIVGANIGSIPGITFSANRKYVRFKCLYNACFDKHVFSGA